MFKLIKEIFIGLLTSILSASNHKKYLPFHNQKCMIPPNFVNLHYTEYSQQLFQIHLQLN